MLCKLHLFQLLASCFFFLQATNSSSPWTCGTSPPRGSGVPTPLTVQGGVRMAAELFPPRLDVNIDERLQRLSAFMCSSDICWWRGGRGAAARGDETHKSFWLLSSSAFTATHLLSLKTKLYLLNLLFSVTGLILKTCLRGLIRETHLFKLILKCLKQPLQ